MLTLNTLVADRYWIESVIGEGGQSFVYKALDTRLNRPVAVKAFKVGSVPLDELPLALQQFKTATEMFARLDHPGLPHIIDFFTDNNTPILVSEYVEGQTMEAVLAASPTGLPESQVIAWGLRLCEILTYLHQQAQPIIFRDLKPDNIMLTKQENLKLIDFGIARTFKRGKSSDTEMLGSPGYAPPEQYGKMQTGPYSDVYALGVTLLRLATGYDPAETPFVFPRANAVNAAVSQKLSDAIERATRNDTQTRFPSATEFAAALAESPRSAPPVEKTLRLPDKPVKTLSVTVTPHRRISIAIGLIVGALAILLCGVTVLALNGWQLFTATSPMVEPRPVETAVASLSATSTLVTTTPTVASLAATAIHNIPSTSTSAIFITTPQISVTATPEATRIITVPKKRIVSPTGIVACQLNSNQTIHSVQDARLWLKPDATKGTFYSLAVGTRLYVVSGPVWGRTRADINHSGWWWKVQALKGNSSGWIWQKRIRECENIGI